MERRHSKRVIVDLKAELISGDVSHAGSLENLSEEGIYMIVTPTKGALDYTPGTRVRLRFQLPSGEKINLNCKIIWSHKTPPHFLTDSIGVEIIDSPQEYKTFLKTL